MNRRSFIAGAVAAAVAAGTSRSVVAASESAARDGGPAIEKSADEWRRLLGAARYHILFEEGTERPWTSELNDEKRDGTYICAACNQPLFESAAKFDSGTGWPSFFRPIEGSVGTRKDWKLLFPRTEYHCARCAGHQGHVFDDGPPPTGQRWCNNGLALVFVPANQPLPALRT